MNSSLTQGLKENVYREMIGATIVVMDEVNNRAMGKGTIRDITERGKIDLVGDPHKQIHFANYEDWDIFIQIGRAYIHPGEVSVYVIEEELINTQI